VDSGREATPHTTLFYPRNADGGDDKAAGNGTCTDGESIGKTPPGGRLCSEPWYDAAADPHTQIPGWDAWHIAHGIFMTAPFALFFPLGALGPQIGFLRSSKLIFHRNCMLIGYASLWIGFGCAIWLALMSGKVARQTSPE
jgi:hypothetical protein